MVLGGGGVVCVCFFCFLSIFIILSQSEMRIYVEKVTNGHVKKQLAAKQWILGSDFLPELSLKEVKEDYSKLMNLKQPLNVMKSQDIFKNLTFNDNVLIVVILSYDPFYFLTVANSTSPYILDPPDLELNIIMYGAQIRALLSQEYRLFLLVDTLKA